jgi:hypothetical protein
LRGHGKLQGICCRVAQLPIKGNLLVKPPKNIRHLIILKTSRGSYPNFLSIYTTCISSQPRETVSLRDIEKEI